MGTVIYYTNIKEVFLCFVCLCFPFRSVWPSQYAALTLTQTEIDKLATVPNGIGVSLQYEHFHIILYKPFLLI